MRRSTSQELGAAASCTPRVGQGNFVHKINHVLTIGLQLLGLSSLKTCYLIGFDQSLAVFSGAVLNNNTEERVSYRPPRKKHQSVQICMKNFTNFPPAHLDLHTAPSPPQLPLQNPSLSPSLFRYFSTPRVARPSGLHRSSVLPKKYLD